MQISSFNNGAQRRAIISMDILVSIAYQLINNSQNETDECYSWGDP